MKRCPTCEKTFEDSMRFCQADGTPLVPDAEPIDPYKTMVARPGEIAASIPASAFDQPKVESEPPAAVEDEVLHLPTPADPLKTMYVSEADIRKEMSGLSLKEDQVIDMPPAVVPPPPEPPAFIEPSLNPLSFDDAPPTPAILSQADEMPSEPVPSPAVEAAMNLTTPPIPSPFSTPGSSSDTPEISPMVPQFKKPEHVAEPPPSSPFNEPPVRATPPSSPFDESPVFQASASTPQNQQMAQAEWTPPPVPESNWQEPVGGQGPPPAAEAGQSSMLAIISLVVGVLSLCCGITFVPGLVAIVLGFMARGKASKDPLHYGGAGLALGGIICGVISLIFGLIGVIYLVFMGGLSVLMSR